MQEVVIMKTVILDDDLKRFKDKLEKEGYKVLDSSMANQADAIIVSGLDNNFMNMQDTNTDKKIIEASGKSVHDIINELKDIPMQ